MKQCTWLLAGLLLVGTAVALYGLYRHLLFHYALPLADSLPENSPRRCQTRRKDPNQQTIVLVGDSLTAGRASADYVKLLEDELGTAEYEFINAGINSQLAYNVLQRLDAVVACEPDVIILLIGTNDANAVALPENTQSYIDGQNLPQTPDLAWYRDVLTDIVTSLQTATNAQIVLLSLPPIGEDPASLAYALSAQYSEVVQDVAEATSVDYLPLFETMDTYLQTQPGSKTGYDANWYKLIVNAIGRRYIWRQSWNHIGEHNGYLLHVDPLHLNETGAEMVSWLIVDFLTEPDT